MFEQSRRLSEPLRWGRREKTTVAVLLSCVALALIGLGAYALSTGAPARAEVGAQIYNQAINTVMVAKFTQGNEKLDDVIKWAENELEGTLRV